MRKLIAKTTDGREFMHSKTNCFFVNEAKAQKACDMLNKNKYKLQDGEKWYIYDYDFSQDSYCVQMLLVGNGRIRAKAI